MVPIDDLLNKLSKTRYTWQELQERPLPEGVDPLKMEAYLHDSEFEVNLSHSILRSWQYLIMRKKDRLSDLEKSLTKYFRNLHVTVMFLLFGKLKVPCEKQNVQQ